MDMISGTNGISGATDTNFVLMKPSRSKSTATLYCTGRDIEYRELNLEFDSETHFWNLLSDNSTLPPLPAVLPSVGRFVASKVESGVRIPPRPFGSVLGRFSARREQSRRKGWGRARPHPGHFCPQCGQLREGYHRGHSTALSVVGGVKNRKSPAVAGKTAGSQLYFREETANDK